MVSVYDLKPKFQKLLRPLLQFLINLKITPNLVTLSALLLSIVTGVLIYLGKNNIQVLIILPIWLFLRMALNAIDGMMAREFSLMSNFGAVLNEVGDVLSDIFIYFPLIFFNQVSGFPIICFLFTSVLTEFVGVLMQALGAKRQYQGPMGKSDRAFWIGLLSLITVFREDIIKYWYWLFWILTFFTIVTCINRIYNGLSQLKSRNGEL